MKLFTQLKQISILIILFVFMSIFTLKAQQYSRGVGVYPGNPKEDFSPAMKIDNKTYRNLALHRPAYQSSSYDFNLTAQLITDGIIESKLPALDRRNQKHRRSRQEERAGMDHGSQPTYTIDHWSFQRMGADRNGRRL